jgi:hypothetical protein
MARMTGFRKLDLFPSSGGHTLLRPSERGNPHSLDLSKEHNRVCASLSSSVNGNRYTKNYVFWDVTPCGSCKNRCLEERIALIIRVTRISELETSAVTISPILFTLKMEVIRFSIR